MKNKQFEDHLSDIRSEFKNGQHLIRWTKMKTYGNRSVGVSDKAEMAFQIYKEGEIYCYLDEYVQRIGIMNALEKDQDRCQEHYLRHLADERLKYENSKKCTECEFFAIKTLQWEHPTRRETVREIGVECDRPNGMTTWWQDKKLRAKDLEYFNKNAIGCEHYMKFKE